MDSTIWRKQCFYFVNFSLLFTVESTWSQNEFWSEPVFYRRRVVRDRRYGGSVFGHITGEFQWRHNGDFPSVRRCPLALILYHRFFVRYTPLLITSLLFQLEFNFKCLYMPVCLHDYVCYYVSDGVKWYRDVVMKSISGSRLAFFLGQVRNGSVTVSKDLETIRNAQMVQDALAMHDINRLHAWATTYGMSDRL